MSATITIQDHMTKSKAFAARTIMNDKKMSKVIDDAINAPAGSLKKAKAKAILESFSNAHKNYLASKVVEDGKGGVGLPASTGFSMNNAPFAKYAPTGFSLLPYQQNKPPQINASIDPATGLMSNAGQNMSVGTASSPNLTPGPMPVLPNVPKAGVDLTPGPMSVAPSGTGAGATGSVMPTPTAQPKDFTEIVAEQGDQILQNYGVSYVDQWYNSLSPTLQKQLKPAYEAVTQGQGVTTFTQSVLNDKQKLKTLLNVPDEVVNSLPDSGLLSDQLIELKNTLDQESGLKNLTQRLLSMVNQNESVERDASNYIRLNDTYLASTDKLLNDFRFQRAFQDESNPNTRQRNDNYENYLTTLQSRQLNRYNSYLDASVKNSQIKTQQIQNAYNIKAKEVSDAFELGKLKTTESYNLVKDMIGELYDNISNQGKLLKQEESDQLIKLNNYSKQMELLSDQVSADTILSLEEFAKELGNRLNMSIDPQAVQDEYQQYIEEMGNTSSQIQFTNDQKLKLESAGLLNASRQEQLNYLYPSKSSSSTFDIGSIDVQGLQQALSNR